MAQTISCVYFYFQKATEACSSLGLTKTMLQSCIYDVAVTNDTSLTSQETLQQGRKNYECDRVNKVKEI